MTDRITATITLDANQLREILRTSDRRTEMVREHGEAISRSKAAELLNVGYDTITRLLLDGRVKAACAGTRIDTRSLADYIEDRGAYDHSARMLRKSIREEARR